MDKANENYEVRALPKLTEAHVYPYKHKMKVSLATQVFSQRMSSIMKLLSRPLFNNANLKDSEGTAELLLFIDKTFDSLNASKCIPDAGKSLSGALTFLFILSIGIKLSLFFKACNLLMKTQECQ